MEDRYDFEEIAPLDSLSQEGDYLYEIVKEVRDISNKVSKSNDHITKKLDDVVSVWMEFVHTMKKLGDDSDDTYSRLDTLIRQNDQLLKQNDDILEKLDELESRVDDVESSRSKYMTSHQLAPKKYPRIKIVK